jgi:plasmid stabilization system protein ParE
MICGKAASPPNPYSISKKIKEAVARKRYILTLRAAADLREARAWSCARWGKGLTNRYFEDLHKGAQHVAENHVKLHERNELAGGTSLNVYPVREHYLVYELLDAQHIVVVAVIRQGRDLPAILRKWSGAIRREVTDVRSRTERGEIKASGRRSTQRRGARSGR